MTTTDSPPAEQQPAARRRRGRPNRSSLYVGLNVGFLLLLVFGLAAGGDPEPRLLYLALLFALCTGPLLYADGANGRYAILTVLMPLMFMYYGVPDFLRLVPDLGPPASGLSTGILSKAEIGILVGLSLMVLGYRTAIATWRGRPSRMGTKDWQRSTVVSLGIVFWLIGLSGTWFWQSEIVERYVSTTVGAGTAIPLLISRLIQPIGVGLLAYAYISSRRQGLLLLVATVLAIEFAFGFIADSKELAMRSAIIVIVGKYLLDGRVPKQWLAIAAVVIALTFGVFQAYRFEVLQMGRQTRAGAAENLSQNVDKALNSKMLADGLLQSGILSFASRINLKPTFELVIERVGEDVAYRNGDTLVHILTSFIPRIIWPEKPDSSVGQLFNREFQASADPDTYISATHLAEFYWNFGWAGLVAGMFTVGFILGAINTRIALAEGRSLTRFLILVSTIYMLCLRFEGSIAIEYIVWMRSVGVILLLHLAFARVTPRQKVRAGSADRATPAGAPPEARRATLAADS